MFLILNGIRPGSLKLPLLPLYIIGLGIYTIQDHGIYSSYDLRADLQPKLNGFRTNLDDYIQFTPTVAVYAFDLTRLEARSDLLNRTILYIKSELIRFAVIYPVKELTRIQRPDGSSYNSFPSGHTSEAFLAATFLHKEFKDESVWISVAGYSIATIIGILRILNDRHWMADVLVGAGIGILSVNLAYITHKYKWGKR